MMYALEHLALHGPEYPQQRRWTQYATCANKALLERIQQKQPRPEEWRVRLSTRKMKKEAA